MKFDYNSIRRKTAKIKVGDIYIGGNAPVPVQSMTNTFTTDLTATLAQIHELEQAGCDIIRVAVPDMESVRAFYEIKQQINIPIVADIHFNYKLAIESVYAGADKVRINPGNIGDESRVKAVADVCNANNIPIRIGVNGGSLQKDILAKYGSPTPEALYESAIQHIELLERYDFNKIIIAIKASNVHATVKANRLLAERCDYPLHLGVTEASTINAGTLKSAAAFGALMSDGIGDTIRVSLTDLPVHEVTAGIEILKSIGVRENKVNVVSCPTCGRTQIELIELVKEFERRAVSEIITEKPITVAMMGCAVNGPGEAREADIGIAGGKGEAVLFKHGEIIRKIDESDIIQILIDEINGEF
jgi:1-hydroxy-2-methyl-2-(E)-butenyl 4-diphosphate synthase